MRIIISLIPYKINVISHMILRTTVRFRQQYALSMGKVICKAHNLYGCCVVLVC